MSDRIDFGDIPVYTPATPHQREMLRRAISPALYKGGPLVTGALFQLPDNAHVTKVLVEPEAGKTALHEPTGDQLSLAKTVYAQVTAIAGEGSVPPLVAQGTLVASPPKEPINTEKRVFAYFGEWAYWSRNYGSDPTVRYDMKYLYEPNRAGGNLNGASRIPLAQQISHLMYSFVFPNQDYDEWVRTINAGLGGSSSSGGGAPAPLFGTVGDALGEKIRATANTISTNSDQVLVFATSVPASVGVGTIIERLDPTTLEITHTVTVTGAPSGNNVPIEEEVSFGWSANYNITEASKGLWTTETEYAAGDVVEKDGVFYAALAANKGQAPDWEVEGVPIKGKYIAGSFFDPAGAALPTGLPPVPGSGYNEVMFSGTTYGPYASVEAFLADGKAGPGQVWKAGDEYWVSFTWAHWYEADNPGGGFTSTPPNQARRIYWRRLIPRGALAWHEAELFSLHMNELPLVKAANPNLKVVFSIGGWTLSHFMSVVANSPSLRETFIASCIQVCKEFGLAGVDIDWEFPGQRGEGYNVVNGVWPDEGGYATMLNVQQSDPSTNVLDKTNLTTLLQEMRIAFDAFEESEGGRYLELSGALGCSPQTLYAYENAFQYMDYVLLMSYDFAGAWDAGGSMNHQAALYPQEGDPSVYPPAWSVDGAVTNVTDNATLGADWGWAVTAVMACPPSKVCVGLPFYGRGWNNGSFTPPTVTHDGVSGHSLKGTAGGAGAPSPTDPSYPGVADFDDLLREVVAGTLTRYWDPVSKVPFLVKAGAVWTYDDVPSIWIKAQYVLNKGLGGVLFWDLPGDTKHYPASVQVVDDGDQFNLIDTFIHVFNNAGSGGPGNVILTRSVGASPGQLLADFNVPDLDNVKIKVVYETNEPLTPA